MKEPIFIKLQRKLHELYENILKLIIRYSIKKLDKLNYYAFMAYSFSDGKTIQYHVIAERFLKDCHIYGTQVDKYDSSKMERT